jgi:hypothetical protein
LSVLTCTFLAWQLSQLMPPEGWILLGPVLLFVYYLVAWWRIGPEPAPGPLVARYEPPEGLSAAAVRYIAHGTTDGRSLAAAIAQLAVSGCVRIEPVGGKYKLSRLMSSRAAVEALAPEEKRVLAALFADGPVIELSPSMEQLNAAQNGRYVFDLHQELDKQFGGKYLARHLGILVPGLAATFAMALPMAGLSAQRDAFVAVFLTAWVLFCGLLLGLIAEASFFPALALTLRTGVGLLRLLPAVGVLCVFGGVIAYVMIAVIGPSSAAIPVTLTEFILINVGWVPLLKRRSTLGRKMADEIAGYKQFLERVEQQPLERIDPAAQRTGDSERHLPFAIALEVKSAWGDNLAKTFIATNVMVEG